MIYQTLIQIPQRRRGCHLITKEILAELPELPEAGLLNLFIKHTSCALSLNENFDPDVRDDLADALDKIAPEDANYRHSDEGEDDMPAHIKSALIGVSLTIPITNGRLNIGSWQGIYLCEFRNHGGRRNIFATIMY